MTRNEAKKEVVEKIREESEKEEMIVSEVPEIFATVTKGHTDKNVKKLASQIQKEENYDMTSSRLYRDLTKHSDDKKI